MIENVIHVEVIELVDIKFVLYKHLIYIYDQ